MSPSGAGASNKAGAEKQIPSLSNQGYFSDYYLAHRLDSGLADLYALWDKLEKNGEPTERTRVRQLGAAFSTHRADAALTEPDADVLDAETLVLRDLRADAKRGLLALNDAVLTALGWAPDRDADPLQLTTGGKAIAVPAAHIARTSTGVLLVALDAVFATDPSAVIASKQTPAGRLLEPVLLNDKAEAHTALEAAQLIFTADDPPNYVLFASGGSVTLLDAERWGEGISLGANLDDALGRRDDKPKGELAAIAALFGAGAINPGDQAQSVLLNLLEKASNESAGVSKELRHGVRRSVELLANAVVRDRRERSNLQWTKLDPKDLTRQSLRYLYRIIVLLFAEARPELGILPVDDPDYQAGYSVARLREVALTDLHTPSGQSARHIQHSLDVLFHLVNEGHDPDQDALGEDTRDLVFPGLRSTLFDPKACELLDKAHLHDDVLQQVIQHLCFTRERAGRGRLPVSYSTLGINQLGAVYEGLMAYSGFLATEPLHEIDQDGDPDNGSWVIPVTRADEFSDEVFLKEPTPEGGERRVRYEEGDFVFRLAGRDRQRSASYYTPEVLTEFTVRHALDVLFDENPDMTAADILNLTICEPALGSGAFITEAIKQLAERYLRAAQAESGEVIDADHYQAELQRAKAHFAVNQAYGVDLNQTAVELAEVSLWLACMHEGLRAPWFGARLRRGNSLVGARRETYTREEVKATAWTGKNPTPPKPVPITRTPLGQIEGIHHFLLPGQGWGAAADVKEVKELDPEWVETIKKWRKAVHKAPTPRQLDRLTSLAGRVEELWAVSSLEVGRLWKATRQHIDVWAADTAPPGEMFGDEPIRTVLQDPRSATSRLRVLMHAWCSLWLWAPQHGVELPTLDGWLTGVEALLRIDEPWEGGTLFTDERAQPLPDGASIEDIADAHPWLATAREIATAQGWFHWELEFSPVFSRGGFDLQVGNPPWVRPKWADWEAVAELDPWCGLNAMPEEERVTRRKEILVDEHARSKYLDERSENATLGEILTTRTREPVIGGQPDLYVLFITGCWRRLRPNGSIGLVHPDTHLSDPNAVRVRRASYRRYREFFHFINELRLFSEITHTKPYGVNIYGGDQGGANYRQASFLYHPLVADLSLDHDGTGELPGRKLPTGEWDLRPHRDRITRVDGQTLTSWALLLEEDHGDAPRPIKAVTAAEASAASALARHSLRVGHGEFNWSRGWDEMSAVQARTVEWRTEQPQSLSEVILQGPHIGVANPFAKQPRSTGSHQQDYELLDLLTLPAAFVPRTNLQRGVGAKVFRSRIPLWDGVPHTEMWRFAVRKMVPSNTYRSLFAALVPRSLTVAGSLSVGRAESDAATVLFAGLLASLPTDYLIRITGVANFERSVAERFPTVALDHALAPALAHRTMRLSSLTSDYSSLWSTVIDVGLADPRDEFTNPSAHARSISNPPVAWDQAVGLRREFERWSALTEIDALAALILGIPAEGLAAIYAAQFPVLRAYEHQMVFDGGGNQLCGDWHQFGYLQSRVEAEAKKSRARGWVKTWDRVQKYESGDTGVDLGPFSPPFRPADRTAAMNHAYWTFVDRYDLAPSDIAERPA